MKIGMNLLLWTGHVTQEHVPVLKAIKAAGFDGVEVPMFDPSDVGHYRMLGQVLDDLGLQRTAVALIPDEAHSPISTVPPTFGQIIFIPSPPGFPLAVTSPKRRQEFARDTHDRTRHHPRPDRRPWAETR